MAKRRRTPRATTATVNWVEVRRIEPLKGHGVELFHAERPQTILAFIDGFEWMRPGAPAIVEIRRAHATHFPPGLRALVRRAVFSVLRRRKPALPGAGRVIQWIVNG